MANFAAIHSVGESLVSYLRHAYLALPAEQKALIPGVQGFSLLSSKEMGSNPNAATEPPRPSLSLYLYRVTVNEHLRNQPHAQGPVDTPPPLALDLHYLLTVWAEEARDEHRLMGWAMHRLHTHQVLSASDLNADGGWGPEDTIQLIPAELSNEDLMRVWDALQRPYTLSSSFIARVVRLEVEPSTASGKPVVARRLGFEQRRGA